VALRPTQTRRASLAQILRADRRRTSDCAPAPYDPKQPALGRAGDLSRPLSADPALAQRYATLKRSLAARYADDREAYTAAKANFIRTVLYEKALRTHTHRDDRTGSACGDVSDGCQSAGRHTASSDPPGSEVKPPAAGEVEWLDRHRATRCLNRHPSFVEVLGANHNERRSRLLSRIGLESEGDVAALTST